MKYKKGHIVAEFNFRIFHKNADRKPRSGFGTVSSTKNLRFKTQKALNFTPQILRLDYNSEIRLWLSITILDKKN